MIDFEQAKKAFENYLNGYDREDDKIRLKIVHTYGVVACAENIAKKMQLGREDTELAKLIALLHDIGRFEQVKRFDSFMPDTMDHAAYGAAILFGKKMLIRKFIEEDTYDSIICTAIEKHSDFQLNGVTEERTLLHARLIRDADKLDNCRVKLEEPIETLLGVSLEEAGKGKITAGVWEDCLSEKSVLSSKRITKPDYWASYIAQLYDVNFPATFAVILENHYLEKMIWRLSYEDADTKKKMKLLAWNLEVFMKNRIHGEKGTTGEMEYVIIGAGGTGGTIGAYMAKAGKNVTLIARGAHLQEIRKNGLTLERLWDGTRESIPIHACTMDEYKGTPDVILVCVKGYSLQDTIPFIRRIAGANTVVIPILNIYGTGARMQEMLPDILVTDGCIYVSANIKEPGKIVQHGKILRIVFGVREKKEFRPVLKCIADDFCQCGISGELSSNIKRDALAKFSYVSPMGTAALYFQAKAGEFQKEGPAREMFKALIREIIAVADAMGIVFETDLVETNLKILSELSPEATTSMQRDVMDGKQSEMDGLVYEVVRLGKSLGVSVPEYEKAAEKFKEQVKN